MKRITIFLLFSLCVTSIFGQQLKKFSMIPAEYFVQMQEFFASTGADSKENLKLIKDFQKNWDEGLISELQKTDILNTSNALLNKRAKPNLDIVTGKQIGRAHV